MRHPFGVGPLVLLALAALVHAPPALRAQAVRCKLAQDGPVLAGTCDRVGQGAVEEVSRRQLLARVWPEGPVRVTVSRAEGGRATWSGVFFFGDWELPFTLAEDSLHGERRTVLRTELAWVVLAESSSLEHDPHVLAFDAADYPLASARDLAILESALDRLDSDRAWDRADDRDCRNDPPRASSLFCLMAAAIEEHEGEYRHRQPALEVLRGVIREGWAERLSGHPLMDFNNHPDTTREDLREALLRASEAAAAEARGNP